MINKLHPGLPLHLLKTLSAIDDNNLGTNVIK